MAVPSARPTNRQINFQTQVTIDWNKGSTFIANDKAAVLLNAVQDGVIERIDAQTQDASGQTVDIQVLINGVAVTFTGPVTSYTATNSIAGLDADSTNTFTAGQRIFLNVTGTPTTDHVVVTLTIRLRDA